MFQTLIGNEPHGSGSLCRVQRVTQNFVTVLFETEEKNHESSLLENVEISRTCGNIRSG